MTKPRIVLADVVEWKECITGEEATKLIQQGFLTHCTYSRKIRNKDYEESGVLYVMCRLKDKRKK